MPRQTAQIFACGTGHTPDRAVAFRVLSGPGVPRCKTGNDRQPFRGVSNFLAPRRQSRRSWIWGCGAAEGIGSETSSHGPTFPMALVARSSRHATGDRWQRPAGAIAKAKLTELDMGLRCGRRYMVGNFQPWLCIPIALPTRSWTHNTTGSGWQHPVRDHRKSEAGGVGSGAVALQKVYRWKTSGHSPAFPVALSARSSRRATGNGRRCPEVGHRRK